MKKLISSLLVIMMVFTMVSAFAEPVEKTNVLNEFLKETDFTKQDIALQAQEGDKVSDVVIRTEGNNVHLVARNDGTEATHIQLTPKEVYVDVNGSVTKLPYAAVATVIKDIVAELDEIVTDAVKSIPADAVPTEAELKRAAAKAAVLASMVAQQAEADEATLLSAAADFGSYFKPEYILDTKKVDGALEVKLRSEAYATALGEAVDAMMLNPALAELIDRQAALTGSVTFAQIQKTWAENREDILEAVRTMENTGKVEENGHLQSHFQIGEETEETKALVCDTDAWIDVEDNDVEIKVTMGLKDLDPIVVYEMEGDSDSFREKMTVADAVAEVRYDLENGKLSDCKINVEVDEDDYLKADFGKDYLYVKGPKGGLSTSVRETWTGKLRYEMVFENADGDEFTMTVDFYEDDDSLVCELTGSESDDSLMFKLSRIDKVAIKDLSTAEKIDEITAEQIEAEIVKVLNMMAPAKAAAPEAGK